MGLSMLATNPLLRRVWVAGEIGCRGVPRPAKANH